MRTKPRRQRVTVRDVSKLLTAVTAIRTLPGPQLVCIQCAATIADVDRGTIELWIKQGRIQSYVICCAANSHMFVDQRDVVALNAHRVAGLDSSTGSYSVADHHQKLK